MIKKERKACRTDPNFASQDPCGPALILKTGYMWRDSHHKDKMVMRPHHLFNGKSYPGRMASTYSGTWILESLTNNTFRHLPATVFIKSCLISLLRKTTCLERPQNLAVVYGTDITVLRQPPGVWHVMCIAALTDVKLVTFLFFLIYLLAVFIFHNFGTMKGIK